MEITTSRIVDAGERQDKDSDLPDCAGNWLSSSINIVNTDSDLVVGKTNNGKESRRCEKRSTPNNPTDVDFLSKEFEDLRKQNCSNLKKPKRNLLYQRQIERRMDELKRRLEARDRGRRRKTPVFEPQMAFWNTFDVVHKIGKTEETAEITGLLQKIVDVAGHVAGANLVEKVGTVSENAGSSFAKGVVEGSYTSIAEMLKNIAKQIFGEDLTLAYVAISACILGYMYKNDYTVLAMVSVSLLLAIVADLLTIGTNVKKRVGDMFSTLISKLRNMPAGEGFEPQMGMLSSDSIADVICMGMFGIMFPKTDFNVKKMTEFFVNFGRVRSSMEDIVNFVLKVLQKATDYVATRFGYTSFQLLLSSRDEVNKWVDDVRTLLGKVAKDEIPKDRKLYELLYQLEESAYALLSQYANTRQVNSIGMLVRPLQVELANIRRGLELMGVWNKKTRQPPVIVVFSGESQIGKSRMLRPFANALIATLGDEALSTKARENFDGIVYSRQPEHVYWDGYTGQEICLFDEFNIVNKSLLTQENAQMDLIRCGNVFENCLHMAELERKGTTYFRSKLILATTNSSTVEAGAQGTVSYPDAVTNRVHFEVLMTVNAEFADKASMRASSDPKYWTLDKSKLPPDGSFGYDVLDFNIRVRKQHPSQPGKMVYSDELVKCNFKQMVLKVASKYKQMEGIAEQIPLDDAKARELGTQWSQELKGTSCCLPSNTTTLLGEQHELVWDDHDSDQVSVVRDDLYSEGDSVYEELLPQMGDERRSASLMAVIMSQSAQVAEDLRSRSDEQVDVAEELALRRLARMNLSDEERMNMVMVISTHRLLLAKYYDMLGQILYQNCLTQLLTEHDVLLTHVFEILQTTRVQDIVGEYLAGKIASILAVATSAFGYFTGAYASMMEWFGSFSPATWVYLQAGLWILAGFATVILEYKAKQWMYKKMAEIHQPREVYKPQVGDPALEDISTALWHKNWYVIKEGENFLGYGFFIEGHTFVFVAHFLDIWESRGYKGKVRLIPHKGPQIIVDVPFLRENSRRTPCIDLVQVEIPNSRFHKDITRFIVSEEDLLKKTTGDCLLVRKHDDRRYDTYTRFKIVENVKYPLGKDVTVRHTSALSYSASTRTGDCGAPLFIIDPTTRAAKLIGIHVAGSPSSNLGLSTTLHQFRNAYMEPQAGILDVDETHRYVRSVKRGAGTTGVSRILPSKLHGGWHPPAKKPAHLRPFKNSEGEVLHPMKIALAKYNTPILTYDQSLVDVCARAAVSNVEVAIRRNNFPLLRITREEAICGIPGKDFFDSVNRSTSPGYPWNMVPRHGYSGKERFFGKSPEILMEGPDWPDLEKSLDSIEEGLRNGVRPEFIFADSLKDELRPIAKVDKGSTRLFCPCPIEYLILFNVYFKSFFAGMMSTRIEGEPTIGINPYSSEWEMLRRKLTRFGDGFVIAGDFESFDARQAAQLLEAIGAHIIGTFDDPEHNEVRTILWKEVFNSFHLCGKDVIEWMQSLPSGHPATSGINCLFVATVFRMVWIRANDGDLCKITEFEANISLADFGDDNVLNVAEPARELINQHTLPALFAEIGLVYTSEDKVSMPPKFRKITEIEFLKRTFRYEPRYGRYCAPLRLETILEIPYWTKIGFEDSVTRTNVETAIRELALHEEEVFNKWVPKIVDLSRRRIDYVPLIVDRNVLLDQIAKLDIHY